jgi:hypothetical protein
MKHHKLRDFSFLNNSRFVEKLLMARKSFVDDDKPSLSKNVGDQEYKLNKQTTTNASHSPAVTPIRSRSKVLLNQTRSKLIPIILIPNM